MAHSSKQLALQRDKVIAILYNFGWLINSQKCNLILAQQYLGTQFDTQSGQNLLPYRKVAELKACVYRVMEVPTLSARDCMTMLEMFTAAILVVPWPRFHMSFPGQWDGR